jgi:uncharacterized protein YndB with AHSA1/START domain
MYVRRSIFIQATPPRVWREFESQEKLAAWFGTGHKIVALEPRVGGKVDIDIEHEREINGQKVGTHSVGSVLVFEPEKELTFETVWRPGDQSIPQLWTLRITPLYEGSLVEVIQHGLERFGKRASDLLQGLEQGWDVHHLVALRNIIEQ